MCKNTETCILEAGENAEEVISAIQEKKAQNKTIILNLFKTKNEQTEKEIVSFINHNYKKIVRKIAEKVYIIPSATNSKNIIDGALWK